MLAEAMADDCQGLEFSFDRVKLPAGGGTAFEIPSAESDEMEMAKDITGVIVYNHPAFAYYRDKYAGGNNPPDCGSFDGVTGTGVPGGSARTTGSVAGTARASCARTSVCSTFCGKASCSPWGARKKANDSKPRPSTIDVVWPGLKP